MPSNFLRSRCSFLLVTPLHTRPCSQNRSGWTSAATFATPLAKRMYFPTRIVNPLFVPPPPPIPHNVKIQHNFQRCAFLLVILRVFVSSHTSPISEPNRYCGLVVGLDEGIANLTSTIEEELGDDVVFIFRYFMVWVPCLAPHRFLGPFFTAILSCHPYLASARFFNLVFLTFILQH